MFFALLFVAAWVGIESQDCLNGGTNFTRPIVKTTYVKKAVTEYRMTTNTPNCDFFDSVWSFLFDPSECKQTYRKASRVTYRVESVNSTELYTICCPGFTEENGTCKIGCKMGKYGENCSIDCNCPKNKTFEHCEQRTGYCMCLPGTSGDGCNTVCDSMHYGPNCSYTCTCENNAMCDKKTGACNCTEVPGWTGISCATRCQNGRFGPDCKSNCTCNVNQTCDHVNGTCICKAGHRGENCSNECESMTYGTNCAGDCPCQKNTTKSCDRINGTCECKPGYEGLDCAHECDLGFYGDRCNSNCSDACVGTAYCHHENGSCICLGKKGTNCTLECDHMTYGENCAEQCKCVNNTSESCDAESGQCECKTGYTGLLCSHECDSGYYGVGCNRSCSDRCVGTNYCHHETGDCICMGKKGENCSEECDSGYYGVGCNSSCSDRCPGTNYCHRETGDCICMGKKGENCSEECDSGYYGVGCNSSCSDRCLGTNYCHRETGDCICMGKKGENCSEETTSDKQMGITKEHVVYIALGGVGIIIVIAVIIIVCCCYLKRKKQREAGKEVCDEKRQRGTTLAVDNVEYIAYDDDVEIRSNVVLEMVQVPRESKLENGIKKTVADDKVGRKSDSPAINRNIKKEALEVKLDKGIQESEDSIHQRKEHNTYLDDESDKINEESNVDMKNNEELEGDYAIGDPDDDAGESAVIYEDADVSSDDDTRDTQTPAVSENDYDYGYHDKSPLKTMSAYNTFEEIRNMRKVSEAGDNVNDQVEDYDHLGMSVRKESLKTTDQEAYSTMKRVRMMSERDHLRGGTSDVEEDETYNTLESEPTNIGRFSHPDYNRVTIADKITLEADNSFTQSQRTSTKRVIVGNGKQPIVQNKLSAVQVQPVGPIAKQTVQSDDDENYPFSEIQEKAETEETENLYENCSDDENDHTPAKVTNAIANNRSISDEAMANDKDKISEEINESSDTETSNTETVVTPPKPTVEHVNKRDPLRKDNVAKLQTDVKTHNPETGNSLQKNGQTGIQKTKDRKLHDYEDFKLQF